MVSWANGTGAPCVVGVDDGGMIAPRSQICYMRIRYRGVDTTPLRIPPFHIRLSDVIVKGIRTGNRSGHAKLNEADS